MKLEPGKTALITGAAGGLGSALARALAARGCHLALVDIDQQALETLAAELRGPTLSVSCHTVDLRNRAAIQALAEDVRQQHSALHLLINNAGITLQKSVETHSEADWQRVFDLNFWGTVNSCKAFLPMLKTAGGAHIVNLSSMAACYGMPSQSSYSSSKAAVQAYSESLRAELRGQHIGVTCINPGAINTKMIQATLRESDDIAQAEANMALAQRFGIAPAKAAQKILAAVERNQAQRFIGVDARLYSLLSKLFPAAVSYALAKSYERVSGRNEALTDRP